MVKLDRLPDDNTIRSFKGTVDFYQTGGLNIARSWPRKRKGSPSLPEYQQTQWMAVVNGYYTALHGHVRRFLYEYTRDVTYTPRDLFFKNFFGTLPDPIDNFDRQVAPRGSYPPGSLHPYMSIQRIGLRVTSIGTLILYIWTEQAFPRLTLFISTGSHPTARIITERRRGRLYFRSFQHHHSYTDTKSVSEHLEGAYRFSLDAFQPSTLPQLNFYFTAVPWDISTNTYGRARSQMFYLALEPPSEYIPNSWASYRHMCPPNRGASLDFYSAFGELDPNLPYNYTWPPPNPKHLNWQPPSLIS